MQKRYYNPEDGTESLTASLAQYTRYALVAMVESEIDRNHYSVQVLSECLIEAASLGLCELCAKLIDRGANVNYSREDGPSALYCATLYGHPNVATMLLGKGSLLTREHVLASPVFIAIVRRDEMLEILLKYITDVNILVGKEDPYLVTAVLHGTAAAVGTLLKRGANPNCRSTLGHAPLKLAIANDRPDVVEILLDSGADPLAVDISMLNSIEFARKFGREQLADFIEGRL